jgi:hypothetical protein
VVSAADGVREIVERIAAAAFPAAEAQDPASTLNAARVFLGLPPHPLGSIVRVGTSKTYADLIHKFARRVSESLRRLLVATRARDLVQHLATEAPPTSSWRVAVVSLNPGVPLPAIVDPSLLRRPEDAQSPPRRWNGAVPEVKQQLRRAARLWTLPSRLEHHRAVVAVEAYERQEYATLGEAILRLLEAAVFVPMDEPALAPAHSGRVRVTESTTPRGVRSATPRPVQAPTASWVQLAPSGGGRRPSPHACAAARSQSSGPKPQAASHIFQLVRRALGNEPQRPGPAPARPPSPVSRPHTRPPSPQATRPPSPVIPSRPVPTSSRLQSPIPVSGRGGVAAANVARAPVAEGGTGRAVIATRRPAFPVSAGARRPVLQGPQPAALVRTSAALQPHPRYGRTAGVASFFPEAEEGVWPSADKIRRSVERIQEYDDGITHSAKPFSS